MRNKFTELMNSCSSSYEPLFKNTSEQDPICILYNNLYSIHTDTHMAKCEECDGYIITGDMRGNNFDIQCSNCRAGELKGFFNIYDFFRQYNLCGSYSQKNGDRVFILNKCVDPADPCFTSIAVSNTKAYYECNSKIPHPISELVIDGDSIKIMEAINSDNAGIVIKNLNESNYIKGNKWISYNGKLYGLVNGKNVMIQ